MDTEVDARILADLIEAATEADEAFPPDELETFAAAWRAAQGKEAQ